MPRSLEASSCSFCARLLLAMELSVASSLTTPPLATKPTDLDVAEAREAGRASAGDLAGADGCSVDDCEAVGET